MKKFENFRGFGSGLTPAPRVGYPLKGGQGRGRTVDLPIFSRTLVPTELPGRGLHLINPKCPAYQRLSSMTKTKAVPKHKPVGVGHLATPTGLEPAASAVTGRRANQLRYGALT